jgi:hypothetical protein
MIYLFKMYRRFTEVNHGFINKLIEVDGIGILVRYSEKKDLKPEIIRRHLLGRCEQAAWIQAPDPRSFREYFRWSYEGARVGKKHPAEWIRDDHPILEVPDCGSLYLAEDDGQVPGHEYDKLICEKTGCYCILNEIQWGVEDDYCPVKQISEAFYKANNSYGGRFGIALAHLGIGRYGLKEEMIDGFKFIRQVREQEPLPLFEEKYQLI